jgi:hypothetical protein
MAGRGASAQAVLAAHGAATRIEAWGARLGERVAAGDYLESGRLSIEIRWLIRRSELALADVEADDPAVTAGELDAATARLAGLGRALAPVLGQAPVLEQAGAGSAECERDWNARRPGANEPARWADEAAAMAHGLGLGAVEIRSDESARSITDAKGARGVALGATVYLHPERTRPGTPDGREVLAHELIHLAQARLPAPTGSAGGGDRDAAEREAGELAPSIAAGSPSRLPRRYIDLSRPAADRDPPGTKEHVPPEAHVEAPSPLPLPHGTREIMVGLGDGSVQGAITGTLTLGKTGVGGVTDADIKAFETTSVTQINGLVTRLEVAVLGGELETDLFEGFKLAVEVNVADGGLEVGTKGPELDLIKVSVKLRGDASHWLPPHPAGRTLTLDGVISVALGGKLAAKLSGVVMAQLEQKFLAREVEVVTGQLTDAQRKHQALSGQRELLAARRGAPGVDRQLAKLEAELAAHRRAIDDGVKQLGGLKHRLDAATRKMTGAINKLRGKLVSKVAGVMQRAAVKRVAAALTKLIPVLNLISAIVDVIELIRIIAAIAGGESGGGEDEDSDEGDGTATPAPAGEPDGPVTGTMLDPGGEARAPEERAAAEQARARLSPAARAVIAATTGPDGAMLDPDQIGMIGLIVPSDLASEELVQILAAVRRGNRPRAAEDVIAAIDAAVQSVRDPEIAPTVTVDGVGRPDLAAGPVSSPDQLPGSTGGDGAGSVDVNDPAVVITRFPVSVARTWFEVRDGALVATDAVDAWRSAHVGSAAGTLGKLKKVEMDIRSTLPTGWNLTIEFLLEGDRTAKHSFFVIESGGSLAFEAYFMVDVD